MNWTIEFEKSTNLVRAVCEGEFITEDCIDLKKDILSRDFWQPGMNILYDYRLTKFTHLKLDELRRLGEFHISKNEEFGAGKMAFLMNSVRDYGLARQYEILTEDRALSRMMVFSDEDEALEWLAE